VSAGCLRGEAQVLTGVSGVMSQMCVTRGAAYLVTFSLVSVEKSSSEAVDESTNVVTRHTSYFSVC